MNPLNPFYRTYKRLARLYCHRFGHDWVNFQGLPTFCYRCKTMLGGQR